jgi:hypothetical protein
MDLRADDGMRGREFNSRRLRRGRSTWVTAGPSPSDYDNIRWSGRAPDSAYIAVEPGTRRILRCSPKWLERRYLSVRQGFDEGRQSICGRPLSGKGKRWGRCCAWSDAVICPAFDAAGRQPPACMGVRGPGPDHP